MCFNISAAAWTLQLPGLRKFVFLALCDRADKAGKCWPSMDWIAARCGISERAARSHVAALVQQGFLRREFRLGRSPIYHVNLSKPLAAPAIAAPVAVPAQVAPAIPAAPPLPFQADTPANAAPIYNHDPIIQTINIAPATAAVDVQVMQDFAAVRKAKRRPAVTRTELSALTAEGEKVGLSLTEVLKTCILRNWVRFDASWLPAQPAVVVAVAPARPTEPLKPASADTITRLHAFRAALKATSTASLAWAHAAIAKKQSGEYVAQQVVRSACVALNVPYSAAF